MPTRLNLYISDEALPGLKAFRTLAAERGLSLSAALYQLIVRELKAAAETRAEATKMWPDADTAAADGEVRSRGRHLHTAPGGERGVGRHFRRRDDRS